MQRLIDIRVVSGEKEEERRLGVCVVGCRRGGPGYNRANSWNTGWVKVPVNSQPSQPPPTRYADQVRVSKVRSTLLRDKRSNRRDNPLPKLQCAGRRFENLYVTSPISAIC